jgi:molecular chaperone Hsp33
MQHDPPAGTLLRALVADRSVRLLAVEARAPAEFTRVAHGLGRHATRLGAEALVAGALAGAHIKGDEQLTLQLQGERPRCAVYVDVTAGGALRARVTPPDVSLAGGRFGGILLVTKHAPGGELYRGATPIDGTTLEQGLAAHFGTSQQVDAIVRLGAATGSDGAVTRAHGLLLERLPEEPGAPSLSPRAFTERFGALQDPVDTDLDELMTGIAFGSLLGGPIEVLERTRVVWQCRCSRQRIEQTLSSLGADLLNEMIEEDRGATVSCHFCTTEYTLSEADLRRLLPQ